MRSIHEDSSSWNVEWKSGRYSQTRKAISGPVQLTNTGPIINAFDPGGGTYAVRLPALQPGRFFVVTNVGGTGILNVQDFSGTAVSSLDPGESTMVFANDNVWTGVSGGLALGPFGPAGPGHSEGLVPDPGPTPADPSPANWRYLNEKGQWTTVAGLAASNVYFKLFKGGAVTLTPAGADTIEFLSGNAALTVLAQSGTSPQSIKLTVNAGSIDHNALLNYVANQHVDHTAVTLTAGLGISGGGDISASRTFDFAPSELTNLASPSLNDFAVMDLSGGGPRRTRWSTVNGIINHNALLNYVAAEHINHAGVSIVASTGLSGGGDITTSRSLALNFASMTVDIIGPTDIIPFYDVSGGDHNVTTVAGLNAVLDHNALLNYQANQHFPDAPVDANAYGRKASAWAAVTPEAPSDSVQYARKNAGWVALPNITVGPVAPSSPGVGDVWIDTN